MCVAVIVASKKRVPSDHLQAMHEANPHGGGIAWCKDGVVMFRKGMTWQEIDAVQDALPRPFLLHFRIATRGAKIPELTHPFPLGMQAFTEDLTGVAEKGVLIHNGTWGDFDKYVPNGIDKNAVSDTQVAAYVAGIDEDVLNEVKWSNAIMTPKKLIYRGQWYQENGNYYSNTHWKRELEWESYTKTFNERFASAKHIPEPRKKSHQEGHNQSNGRTITKDVKKYPTTFTKSGGSGVHTKQSNGKTIEENRRAKQEKRSGSGKSAYEQAKENYRTALQLSNGVTSDMRNYQGPRAWDQDTAPLFSEEERATFHNMGRSVPVNTNLGIPRTSTAELGKYTGPYVPCPDCNQDIKTIPCACGMNSEEALEKALDEELKQLEALDKELDETLQSLDDEGEYNVEVSAGGLQDLADVEDMNAYGESLGLDGFGTADDYLNPDFADVQKTIQAEKVTMKGESTENETGWSGYPWMMD